MLLLALHVLDWMLDECIQICWSMVLWFIAIIHGVNETWWMMMRLLLPHWIQQSERERREARGSFRRKFLDSITFLKFFFIFVKWTATAGQCALRTSWFFFFLLDRKTFGMKSEKDRKADRLQKMYGVFVCWLVLCWLYSAMC